MSFRHRLIAPLLLVVLRSPVLASEAVEAPRGVCEGTPRLALVFRDETSIGLDVGTVEQEVRQIFASAGIALDWRLSTTETTPPEGEITVLFRARPESAMLDESTLGAVNRNANGIARVFLSGLERILGVRVSREQGLRPAARQRLARTLGRVLAHEVVHVVAPGLGHTPHGLMEANMPRSFALQARVTLDRQTTEAVLGRLQAPAARTANGHLSSPPSSSCTRSL
jgi:hypothetical protein